VRDLPTLFLDATGNPLIAGAVKPGTRFRKIDARQNVHVTQVVDRTLSKWSLLDAPDAERTRATVQTAILEFARGSSTGLLVTYKAAVGHFEVPAGWVKAHFGSPMRGVDEWKDFEAVAVLGCWTPRPDVVENQGAVLTMLTGGSMSGTGQEARELRDIHMADGSGVGVQVRTHPDPMAAAVGLSRDWGCESGRRYSRAGFPR
jgi:hypothetical protein